MASARPAPSPTWWCCTTPACGTPKLALEHLCSPLSEVSAHYVVMEDGHIVQCVPESRRAWHAGESSWAGETDINSCSIGIEIANPGHDYGYPDFPRRQIAAVIALCRSIFTRHRIPADRVLAPFRRRALAQEGSGREIPLAAAARFRDRAVGEAGADHGGGRPHLRARRPRSGGGDAADVAAQPRLRHREDRQLRLPRPWRWSPPSSATTARPRSTASPTSRRWRRCARCWRRASRAPTAP